MPLFALPFRGSDLPARQVSPRFFPRGTGWTLAIRAERGKPLRRNRGRGRRERGRERKTFAERIDARVYVIRLSVITVNSVVQFRSPCKRG